MLDVNLYGLAGGQRVNIVAQVTDPKPGAAGWAQISGENLEVDERLIAAVDQRIEIACDGKTEGRARLAPPRRQVQPRLLADQPAATLRRTADHHEAHRHRRPRQLRRLSLSSPENQRRHHRRRESLDLRQLPVGRPPHDHGQRPPDADAARRAARTLASFRRSANLLLDEGLFWAVARSGSRRLEDAPAERLGQREGRRQTSPRPRASRALASSSNRNRLDASSRSSSRTSWKK